jgi:hypothetical protein
MLLFLDVISLIAAIITSWLWFAASRSTVRRISAGEEIDHRDLNRIIVSFNRTQILNGRAAFMSAVSALCIATRFAAGMLITP